MRKIIPILLIVVVSSNVQSQSYHWDADLQEPVEGLLSNISVNLQNNFGYTIVDVSQAIGIPKYSHITDEGLVDWNQFNYKGLVQILFNRSEDISLGLELGFHRLYYWEEKYIPSGLSPRWRWGTIWTMQLGALVRRTIVSHYYVMAGSGLHIFLNGSGATIGFPLAIGHELPISEAFTIPIEFRIDIIFGKAIPISLGGGVGLKFNFSGQN